MIHTYDTTLKYVVTQDINHEYVMARAMEIATAYFKPSNLRSIDIYTSTCANPSDGAEITVYVNITYDTDKDKNVSKTITGGRSIPVPSH